MFRMVLIGLAFPVVLGCSSTMRSFPVTDASGQKFRDRVRYDTEVDDRLIVSSADLEIKTDLAIPCTTGSSARRQVRRLSLVIRRQRDQHQDTVDGV
jgi:hypothetical protein